MSQTVFIEIDLKDEPEDGRAPLTWGKLRELVGYYTPSNDDLKVQDGLSAPVRYQLAYGEIRVGVHETVDAFPYLIVAKSKGVRRAQFDQIIGSYRSEFEANAVCAAWNKSNGDIATYKVVSTEEF